jgi:hypothetical protein
MLKWPRGRYNGKRIAGVEVRVRVNLLNWFWRPRISWNFGTPYFHWLCFNNWAEPVYTKDRDEDNS